jgi:hypothetical protein
MAFNLYTHYVGVCYQKSAKEIQVATSHQRHEKHSSAKPLCNVKEESNEFRSMDGVDS